jgi:hypothetical protein
MAQVWAIVILGVLLALVTAALLSWTGGRTRHALVGVAIGAAGGLTGAFLILDSRMDVIPDGAEGAAVAVLIVLGSLGLIMVTLLRWTRS